MTIPERLTFEPTPWYAGTWYRVDGNDRYFTEAYVRYMERRDARARRIQHGAVRVEQMAPKAVNPYRARKERGVA